MSSFKLLPLSPVHYETLPNQGGSSFATCVSLRDQPREEAILMKEVGGCAGHYIFNGLC